MKMKHAQGKWKYSEVRDSSPFKGMYVIHNEEEDFAYVEDYSDPYNDEKKEANAKLIAEAGTVANETGYTPRQLADQKAELLEALKELHENAQFTGSKKGEYRLKGRFIAKAYDAIKKATE